jgi:peptidoglycan-associated lipoprotein
MHFRTKFLFFVIAIISSGLIIMSGCGKRVSTTQTEETTKPEAEVARPTPTVSGTPETTIIEPPVSQIEVAQEDIPIEEKTLEVVIPSERLAKGINDIYFDYDRYIIRDDAKDVLRTNADLLKGKNFRKLVIEGHCDERGTSEYNIALGERRAESAKRYLSTLGIDSSKISVISFGEEKPFCSEQDENCWQQNRRAHFILTE